jgi:hypothetical protein
MKKDWKREKKQKLFFFEGKSQVVYCCAAVMLFCRVAVNFKTAALQHRNTLKK